MNTGSAQKELVIRFSAKADPSLTQPYREMDQLKIQLANEMARMRHEQATQRRGMFPEQSG